MSASILTDYLQAFVLTYMKFYPNRNVGMINTLTHGADRQPLADTGICFGLALTLKALMKTKHCVTPELIYIYRRYDATNGDGFEDTLVHCVLLLNGWYYDAINSEGVDSFSSLWFVRGLYKPHEHYIVYPERAPLENTVTIPNNVTLALHQAFEKTIGFRIERPEGYK